MPVDIWARVLAISALVVSLLTLVLNYFVWVRSGGRLRVRLKVAKHHFDPMQHRIVLTVTNVGRAPVRIAAVGIQQVTSNTSSIGLGMPLVPKGESLTRILEPGVKLEAEASMPDLVKRWDWDLTLQLRGWAELEDGRRREPPWQSIVVRTPRKGADGPAPIA